MRKSCLQCKYYHGKRSVVTGYCLGFIGSRKLFVQAGNHCQYFEAGDNNVNQRDPQYKQGFLTGVNPEHIVPVLV